MALAPFIVHLFMRILIFFHFMRCSIHSENHFKNLRRLMGATPFRVKTAQQQIKTRVKFQTCCDYFSRSVLRKHQVKMTQLFCDSATVLAEEMQCSRGASRKMSKFQCGPRAIHQLVRASRHTRGAAQSTELLLLPRNQTISFGNISLFFCEQSL